MSDYIVEVIKSSDNNIEVSTSHTFITLGMPSGYPIEDTSGDLPYTRVSGLATYIQSFIAEPTSLNVDGGTP